jgi:hypothetical protein
LESKHSKPGAHVAEPDLNSVRQLRNNCMDLMCCQRRLLQAKNVEPVKKKKESSFIHLALGSFTLIIALS